jgi:hypothetical protein
MSAIITPFVQEDTGIAIFSADPETRRLIRTAKRFLLSPLPREQAEGTSDGVIDLNYSLVANESLKPFFSSEKVLSVLGGSSSVFSWVKSNIHRCQAPDSSWCDNNLTTVGHNGSAVRLCWHHDNEYMMKGLSRLSEVFDRNRANWVLDWACTEMRLPRDRDLSMIELTFWAIRRGLKDVLPEEAGRIALCREKEEVLTGTLKESDITFEYGTNELLDLVAEQIVSIAVDDESGLLYMARPKILLGKSPAYLRFIISRPCIACSSKVNTPFLYRARGLNEHDRWCVPLCDTCARDAAQDVRAWEKKHNLRFYVIANQIYDFAVEHGVISYTN